MAGTWSRDVARRIVRRGQRAGPTAVTLSLYQLAWRPAAAVVGRSDPETAHARTLSLMRRADGSRALLAAARLVNRLALPPRPMLVGGVELPQPVILAAGLVKGDGFEAEAAALAAVQAGRDIVPGWRSAPALLGPVEFGSYTRWPRTGNAGRVLWRDVPGRSMQNRVGLRNPGARAAAAFLAGHAAWLPRVWGLNLAVSPGLDDPVIARAEIDEALELFATAFEGTAAGPAWITLNLSCPNTEDDPHGNQSVELAEAMTSGLPTLARRPLWVKVGPDLSDTQLAGLVAVFARTGVRAVVATNTLARPTPDGVASAGLSGAGLRPRALDTVVRLSQAIEAEAASLDIVAAGGILAGADLQAFRAAGARAAMVYSALVFRGPLAGACILAEADT
jgi:dihydroorotate dehydrogenase